MCCARSSLFTAMRKTSPACIFFKRDKTTMLNWIHRRMSVGARLGLIATLMVVPTLVFAGLFVQANLADISFAEREMAGADYIQAVWPAFDNQNAPAAPIAAARERFDVMFGTADEADAYLNQTDPALRRQAGVALFIAIADASGLTLDPDLDSFYLMDAVVLRMPTLHNYVGDVAAAVQANDPLALAVALDHLRIADEQVQNSLRSAIAGNDDGGTRSALEGPARDTAQAVLNIGAQVSAGQGVSEDAFDTAADGLWGAASLELDRVIADRIAALQMSLVTWLSVAVAILAIAMVLMFLISGAMSSRIKSLVASMERLAADDETVDIPCQDDRNETGQIAQSLVIFKDSLIERQRLRAETATMHERTAQRLKEMEDKHAEATRDLASVIAYTKEGLAKLYEGDLTFRLKEFFPVDFKSIRMDFNQTAQRLEDTMRSILHASDSMGGTATEIATAADDLSHRTEQQAAGLEETAAALEEITVTVKRNADNATRMRDVATEAGSDAKVSGEVLKRTVEAMDKIERSSAEIARILSVIDEISFQTNLLALNAGVEAARAGDAGRGFAVVASEVRALAQRSAEAAKEIKSIISTSSSDVEVGVKLVGQTATALERIAGRVGEIHNLVSVVASASDEEARGVSEVSAAVNQMDQITQQNAAMVEQSTAASHNLAQEAQGLAEMVRKFKVGGGASAQLRLAS
jgi:methyl-accepting chemotaxis protein